MLTASYLDVAPDPIVALYAEYEQSVINDIARRLVKMGEVTDTAAWQMQRLTESGKVYDTALAELANLTGKSEEELNRLFRNAGVKTMQFDDAIYKAAGLDPLPLNLSPAMLDVLTSGLQKTKGVMQNLTMTTALTSQDAYIKAADLAYMQITGGAMDYQSAIKSAIKRAASDGVKVRYPSGHEDHLDVAIRRTVLTGVSQTAGKLQERRADEMGADLVQTSAHIGARNTGTGPANHEGWQGKIFSRSGTHPKYPDFVQSTGYGTGAGLQGWNCVTGDTRISSSAICALYRRPYSGELIVIHTARGHELTITPNHPILTDKGWIAAGLLNEGDNIISRPCLDRVSGIGPDVDQNIASIQDMFNTLAVCGDVFSFPVSPGDFHSDISDSQVDVVFPNGLLRGGVNSTTSQEREKSLFGDAIECADVLISESAFNQVIFSSSHASDSVMCSLGECGASAFPFPCHPFTSSIGAGGGNGHAHFSEVFPYQSFGDSDTLSDFVFPKTRLVQTQEFVGGDTRLAPQVDSPIIRFVDSVSLKTILNRAEGTSVIIGDTLVLFTGHETLDNITFIERKSTQGSSIHVYNLETIEGWYFANGIITHNCRHSYYPFFEGISAEHYKQAELQDYANKRVIYNGQELSVYEATQEQRAIERKIRKTKRESAALEAAGLDNTNERLALGQYQSQMRDFVEQTGLQRQRFREQMHELGKQQRALYKQPAKTEKKVSEQSIEPVPSVAQKAVVDRGSEEIVAKAQSGFIAIDQVHSVDEMPPFLLSSEKGIPELKNSSGIFAPESVKSPNPNDPEDLIACRSDAQNVGAAFVHEYGHMIDYRGIGAGWHESERAATRFEGPLKDWWEAVYNSSEYRHMIAVIDNPDAFERIMTDETGTYKVKPNADFARYLSEPKELWARSYAQYIGRKTGNKFNFEGQGNILPMAWDDNSFTPIEKAIDDLFRSKGWLK